MKQQPIVVLDRIRMAVSAERIQRETEASGADGKTGLHHSGDSPRTNSEPMHGDHDFLRQYGFLALVDAKN